MLFPFSNKSLKVVAAFSFALLCQACTLTIPLDDPGLSETAYTGTSTGDLQSAKFISSLPEGHEVSIGRLSLNLKYDGATFDAASFVKTNLTEELRARGIPLEVSDSGKNLLDLKEYEIYNRRISGFSPLVTVTTARLDINIDGEAQRIVSVVKMAKVPVWSMEEINEPCFNQPSELVIKEFAAKINSHIGNRALTDLQVATIVDKIRKEAHEITLSYLDVYELGFSNNPSAIPALLEFSRHKSDYARLAAISSLGILRATDSIDHLKQIYNTAKLWQDRGMALKALGDMNTPESLEFLSQERTQFIGKRGDEASWNDRIIGLYLD